MRSRLGPTVVATLVLISALSVTVAHAAPARPVVTDIGTYTLLEQPARAATAPPATTAPGRVWPNLHYAPAPYQALDLYLPDRSTFPGPWPTILWLHGGGWQKSLDRHDTTPIIQRELGRGFAVASADYALAPTHRFPDAIGDVKLAIRWIKARGGRYGLDASTVIVGGGSSGAYLAAMAGATPGRFEPHAIPAALRGVSDTVAAVIDLVGPTDFVTFDHEAPGTALGNDALALGSTFLGCTEPANATPKPCPPGLETRASIAPHLTRASPPVFMVYGATDVLVPARTQAMPLAKRWAALTGPNTVWVQIAARVGHNLDPAHVNVTALDRFLTEVVRGEIGRCARGATCATGTSE